MKWKHRTPNNSQVKTNDEVRTIKKFAWFPKKMTGSDITVWLGFYHADQKKYFSDFAGSWWNDQWYYIKEEKK